MIYQDSLDLNELKQYAAAINARARSINAVGIITAEELRSIILESGGMCQWCGTNLVHQVFEIEHVMTLSRGGVNAASNLVVSCPTCNRKKAEKHPARFALELVAEIGTITPFLQRVFDHYGEEPKFQPSLIQPDDTTDGYRIKPLDEDSSPTQQYRW